jgi:3'(2'), 5'-bisphosphate nucleotidase
LDGTKGFVTGNVDWVTVLIGIAYNGKPIAGVIVQPFGSKLVVWGAVGVGAFGYSILQEPSPDRRIIVSTQHHSTPELEDYIRQLNPTQVINVSGAGGKSLYVLQGLADAYVHPSEGTKKWDTCAPDAIIKAAGGVFTDRFGNEIYYGEDLRVGIMKYQNENGVVVAMRNHQSYIKL